MQADLQVQERVQVEQKKADKIDVDSEGKLTVTVRSMTGSDVIFYDKASHSGVKIALCLCTPSVYES